MILQDLAFGNGVGVIAPEAEMIHEELLPFIPDDRIKDVIYFNPNDEDAPVSFNPLHLDEGEDPDLKVDEIFTIFKRVVGETGPRMDEILRQTFSTLVRRPGSTFLDVERLLDRTDTAFRNEVVKAADPRSATSGGMCTRAFQKRPTSPARALNKVVVLASVRRRTR